MMPMPPPRRPEQGRPVGDPPQQSMPSQQPMQPAVMPPPGSDNMGAVDFSSFGSTGDANPFQAASQPPPPQMQSRYRQEQQMQTPQYGRYGQGAGAVQPQMPPQQQMQGRPMAPPVRPQPQMRMPPPQMPQVRDDGAQSAMGGLSAAPPSSMRQSAQASMGGLSAAPPPSSLSGISSAPPSSSMRQNGDIPPSMQGQSYGQMGGQAAAAANSVMGGQAPRPQYSGIGAPQMARESQYRPAPQASQRPNPLGQMPPATRKPTPMS